MELAINKMRCICCDADDKWKNVDEFRVVPKGMSICMNCGFVSYPSMYKSEDEIKAYYRKDYRNVPKVGNLFTGSRKLHNHDAFLGPALKEMKKRTETPVIGEVGAALGMVLNHIRQNYFPNGEFYGTELTTTYRRVAFHEYGLNLSEDFDLSKQYDLIISYKVAEHQMDIDKRLREYALALKPDGLLYISVPTWFEAMTNFGLPGFDLEYYYEPSHINVWTKKLFEMLLKKAGLEVIKYDGLIYNDTYLCKRNDDVMKMEHPEFEQPDQIMAKMKFIKEAFEHMKVGNAELAVKAYPNYPEAWTLLYERRRHEVHQDKQGDIPFDEIMREFYEPFRSACGDCYETWRFVADLALRYDQFELSLEYWQRCIQARPGAGYVLGPITHCYRRMADVAKDEKIAMALRKKSAEITKHWVMCDLESRPEAMNWLYYDLAKLPMPGEA